MKFTFEESQHNHLPFLDIDIVLKDGEFITSIYRKDTFTGLLVNFHAVCPIQWKRGLIVGLLHRAYETCSSWKSFRLETEKIEKLLLNNSYPHKFVSNILTKFMETKMTVTPENQPSESVKHTFQIPYVGKPSIILKKKLIKLFKSYSIDINVCFNSFKVKNYFVLKDKQISLLQSSLVYKFSCLVDPSKSYIGKTKRYLYKRVQEHKRPNSQIYTHCQNCATCQNSEIFKSFHMLKKASTDFELQILESIIIMKEKPSMNKQLSGEGASFIPNVF